MLDSLQGSQWFSSLDLKYGYWQVEMDEESRPLTAFTVGPLGFYECKRMPFGLTNAPATFQRLMENCLGDLNLHWCIIYLDDIVIFSKDSASHLERLETVFRKLEEAGLKLKPSKCELFQRKLAYLGHVISAKGVATDEGKIEAIKNWPTPTNVTEVRSFLGFTGNYCRFIPNLVEAWYSSTSKLPNTFLLLRLTFNTFHTQFQLVLNTSKLFSFQLPLGLTLFLTS